jgi:hypothetical protein
VRAFWKAKNYNLHVLLLTLSAPSTNWTPRGLLPAQKHHLILGNAIAKNGSGGINNLRGEEPRELRADGLNARIKPNPLIRAQARQIVTPIRSLRPIDSSPFGKACGADVDPNARWRYSGDSLKQLACLNLERASQCNAIRLHPSSIRL